MDPTSLEAMEAASASLESLSEALGASLRLELAEGVYSAAAGQYDALTASLWLSKVQALVDAYGPVVASQVEETLRRIAESNEGWARAVYREAGIPWEGYEANSVAYQLVREGADRLAADLLPTASLDYLRIRVSGRDLDVREAYDVLATAAHADALGGTPAWKAARAVSDALYDEGAVRVISNGRSYEVTGYCRQRVQGEWQRTMQGLRDEAGRECGLTSVEVSAHQPCAPDHLPYQGRVFTRAKFDQIQESLGRPIGEGYNCRHLVTPCRDGARPTYTEEERRQMAEYSDGVVTVGGRERTRYEATKWQREQERKVRNLKLDAQLADAQGDAESARAYRRAAREVASNYREQSEAAHLPTDPRRMRIGRLGGA